MKKLISFIAASAILLNNLIAPLSVLAQEASPTPTSEETIKPTGNPTPTPDTTLIDSWVQTPDVTNTPDETPLPTPTDLPIDTEAPEGSPTTPGPPEGGITGSETLNETFIENIDLSQVSEINSNVLDSGTITTDKPDYSPTSIVLITGSGFIANKIYTVNVVSADEPPSDFTDQVKADESGNISYAYQLDGNYRPNYTAYIKNGEVVVAKTSFTDTNWLCSPDAQGVNDEPGQKDLTKMCRDLNSTDPVLVTWNWDEISPGGNTGGNTGDACSLFDTNKNNFADYSLCVIVDGNPSVYQNKVLYSCGDDKADRCTNPIKVVSEVTSTCGASVLSDDPFSPSGTNYPNDTVANCSINLSDVGGASEARLLDVCSYPSQQPNSDPSDCIIAATDNETGTIEVIKDLYPTNDPGRFNLQIDSTDIALNVGDGGTTGTIGYATGTHTIGETAYTGTDLANYTTSINCGSEGSVFGVGPLTVDLSKNENIICTITNTRKQGSIELQKDFVGTPENVSIKIGTVQDGSDIDSSINLAGDGTTGENTVNTGTYYVSESLTNPSNYTSALACYDDSNHDSNVSGDTLHNVDTNTGAVSIATDDDVICVFTNTRKQGTVVVKKVMVGGTDTFSFTGTPSGSINANEGIIQATVDTGQYTSIEGSDPTGWELTDLVCTDSDVSNSFGDKTTKTATFNVEYNETVTCTFTNTKYGSISGYKYEEGNPTPLAGWVISLYNGDALIASQSTTLAGYNFSNLLPGIYSLFEDLKNEWTPISSPPNVDLSAGEISSGNNFINFENISITACKKVDADGDVATTRDQINKQGWTVKLIKNGQVSDTQITGSDGCYTWTNNEPGIYGVTEETLPPGWFALTETTHSFGTAVSGQDPSFTFVNFEKGQISGYKWNDLNGDGDWDKPEEPAIEGWTIYATYPDQSSHSAITNSSGYYDFSDLGPGQYTIYENPPAGWSQTFPGNNYVIDMVSNGDFGNKDFGNQARGTITIIKDAAPNNAQNFGFTSTQLGSFTLDDDSDPIYSNTKVFSNKGSGTYTIAESATTGWKLTDLVCTGDKDVQINKDARTVTLTIDQPGEAVTCTFTNTKYGFMQGRKYLDNNLNGRLDSAESSTFQDNWTINLYDSGWQFITSQLTGNGSLLEGQYRFDNLLPGIYYTCEVLPVGWQQIGPILGSHPVDYNNHQVNVSTAVLNGSGAQNEASICWQSNINGDEFGWLGFGNIEKGHIIVDKVTDPSGDPQIFSFDAMGNDYADFDLADQSTPNDQELLPGTYSLSEAVPKGWELTSAVCTSSIKDRESIDSLELDPGETINCTFNNLKLIPLISIAKSNDKSGGASAGDTIIYTLTLTNDGNTYLYNIDVTDLLPGGFSCVLGSTTGATSIDPLINGGTLTWEDVGNLGVGESLTISYQAKIASDAANGIYTNYATCRANYGIIPEGHYSIGLQQEEDTIEDAIECDPIASSTVPIGSVQGYSGNLVGQVLGISTELPATGNPTWVLVAAIVALGTGIFLNIMVKKKNVKK